MTLVTYMPKPEDQDDTVVAGIAFRAYEPVEVSSERQALLAKFDVNPWFTVGDTAVDQERKDRWEKSRMARARAAQLHAAADKLEKKSSS